jgi:hypothetical protein
VRERESEKEAERETETERETEKETEKRQRETQRQIDRDGMITCNSLAAVRPLIPAPTTMMCFLLDFLGRPFFK